MLCWTNVLSKQIEPPTVYICLLQSFVLRSPFHKPYLIWSSWSLSSRQLFACNKSWHTKVDFATTTTTTGELDIASILLSPTIHERLSSTCDLRILVQPQNPGFTWIYIIKNKNTTNQNKYKKRKKNKSNIWLYWTWESLKYMNMIRVHVYKIYCIYTIYYYELSLFVHSLVLHSSA